jgi:general secretion pathway protein G
MHTQPHTKKRMRGRKGRRGLTLIEILVVVTILGLIAGIVGITVAGQLEEAKIDATKIQIKNLSDALELYKVKLNRYPSTAEGLNVLVNPPEGRKPFMETIPNDSFNQGFIYISPGTHNPSKFDLYSKGPDGVADTEDDITNW